MLARHLIRFAAPRTVSTLPALALVRSVPRQDFDVVGFSSALSLPEQTKADEKKKVKLPIDVYDNNKEWWEQITSPHDFMPKVGTAGFTVGCAMIIAMIMYNECEESEEEAENERLRQARLAAKDKQRSPAAVQ
ncbi:hypothetical protein FOZ60_000236 [Perkinsus olseni]|uniref:Uncharacterized protein n=1 Tax=Perkinsus olseni TaxID=32597 RepID=A0A7J6PL90_PEROL|nr:hypothetical protein FOZ60_000236 [Perkinsus olseni]